MRIFSGEIVINSQKVLINLAKIQLFLMIVYEGWYLQKYPAIPGVLQILALTIIFTTTIILLRNLDNGKNRVIKYWVFFGIYSLIAAIFVNASLSVVMDSLFTFFAFIAVVYCAGVVSRYTSDYAWFSRTILFVSLISAFCVLFDGAPYQNGLYYVITMGELNNPNNLGLVMSIGSFMVVFPERKPSLFGWIVRVAILFMFLIVTINTGSRSSVLCELAVIAVFIYTKIKSIEGTRDQRLMKKSAVMLTVVAASVVLLIFVTRNNDAGSAIRRLIENFNNESFTGRTELYDLAWEMYKKSPIFGIGYNCFATLSDVGYFTHSTYMELLACTGTIGFILFLAPVLSGTWRGIKAFKLDGGRAATILIMMLISGFFGIVYYNMVFLMVLYMEINRIPKKGDLVK